MLGAMAEGRTVVEDLNDGEDVAATMRCLRQLGVRIQYEGRRAEIQGRAGILRCPTGVLDCGNSGTSLRLLAGIIASQDFTATLDGDTSLRARPMRRIAVPLRGLGVRVEGPDNGEHAPLIVTGPARRGGSFSSPVASAQIKSAALLAGAFSSQRVRIEEPGNSRDHTERMLNAFGMECRHGNGFALVDPEPGQVLEARELMVAADPSAAALLAACALAVPGSEVEFRELLLNPRRTGFMEVLRRMGAPVQVTAAGTQAGEEVGTLAISSAKDLQSTTISPSEIPGLIDEIPALAVVAALATGTTVFEGVAELRLKESDRLASLVELLDAFSIVARATDDRLEVSGGVARLRGGLPETADHRILMATAALGLAARASGQETTIELDPALAAVSDPRFFGLLQELDGAARI
jgi:3-phosphoshikimate 1-carboxyvinyltransferase